MSTNKIHPLINKAGKLGLLGWLAVFSFLLSSCVAYPTPIPCGDIQALIDAIHYANSNPATLDIIELDAGCTYTIEAANETSEGATGLPYVTSPIRIVGNGATLIRKNDPAAPLFRLIFVGVGGELELQDMTLENGYAFFPDDTSDVERNAGGALRNVGMLVVYGVTIQNNGAYGVTGGIFNEGDLVVKASTIRWNDQEGNAYAMGGATAIHNRIGTSAVVVASTISENGLSGLWNAVTNSETSYLSIENSTISGNSGTGINNDGDLDLMYVTITGNNLGIWSVWYGIPKINMTGTLFQNSNDCNIGPGVMVTSYYNMDSDGSCGVMYTVPAAAMLLGPLASNGGPTQTHALLSGSPAVDAVTGPASRVCPIIDDQRGVSRPQMTFCDIGAYEYNGLSFAPVDPSTLLLVPFIIDTPSPTPTFTPVPTPTFTPTPVPSVSRCDLFDSENATLMMHDIPYGTTNLTLYVQWPHPVWGLEEPVEGDEDYWSYAATLGSTTANNCTYEGYGGRLYCTFILPETAMGATIPLYVYVNKCLDPIFIHEQVSIFEPIPECTADLSEDACQEAGGTFNIRTKRCNCP